MVQVLVVDDEREIRNGLVTRIPWAEWGVDRVYDADDGDTALELARRHSPDLIITDIQMPRMSGLQLIEELYRNGFEGSFIVISGYDDFHFSKKAFKLGVSDYLLKPINKQELSQAVALSLQRLREQSAQKQTRNLLQQGFEQALSKMREEVLQELAGRPYRESEALRIQTKLKQLKLDWLMSEPLRLAVFGIADRKSLTVGRPAGEIDFMMFKVNNILEFFFKEQCEGRYVIFQTQQDNWVVVLGGQGEGEPVGEWRSLTETACEHVLRYTKINVFSGVSETVGTIDRLFDMHQEALDTLVYSKVHRSLPGYEADADEWIEGVQSLLLHSADMVELLKYGTQKEIREAMEDYPKLVTFWDIRRPEDLQHYTFEWLLELFRTAQKTGWNESYWEKNPIEIWEHLERFDTLESLQQQVTVKLLEAAESMKEQFISRSQIVSEAQHLIRHRYNENLTLQMVAQHVHVTPVWLSKLFKKETGMNFLEYLTDIRLKRATELLMDLNYKVYQVSYTIGYQDPVHFSRLFKKKYGCTPQKYRNHRGNRNG